MNMAQTVSVKIRLAFEKKVIFKVFLKGRIFFFASIIGAITNDLTEISLHHIIQKQHFIQEVGQKCP